MERAGDDMAGGRTGATGRRTGNRVVDALGRMDFTGNVIPTAWFETMRDERGRPDLVGMNLLAEIVYRYRPQRSRDEEGREVWSKRFRGDMLPLDYARLEDRFGCSHVTMRRAFARLEGLGVVRRVSQAMRTGAGVAPTVMYVTIDPARLAELTYPAPAGPTRRQRKRAGGDRWSDLTTCDEQAIVENSEAPLPEAAESPSTGASRADETPVESRWSKMTTCDEQAIVENSDEAPVPSAEESTHDELRVCDETADDSRWSNLTTRVVKFDHLYMNKNESTKNLLLPYPPPGEGGAPTSADGPEGGGSEGGDGLSDEERSALDAMLAIAPCKTRDRMPQLREEFVRARRRLGLSPREVADLYALYLSTRELWPGGDAMQRIRFPLTWLQSRTGLEATVEHVRADRAAARKRATRAMGADELADKARLARETSGVESSRGWIAILPTGAAVAVEGSSASSDDEAAARAKLRRQLRGQVTRHG